MAHNYGYIKFEDGDGITYYEVPDPKLTHGLLTVFRRQGEADYIAADPNGPCAECPGEYLEEARRECGLQHHEG